MSSSNAEQNPFENKPIESTCIVCYNNLAHCGKKSIHQVLPFLEPPTSILAALKFLSNHYKQITTLTDFLYTCDACFHQISTAHYLQLQCNKSAEQLMAFLAKTNGLFTFNAEEEVDMVASVDGTLMVEEEDVDMCHDSNHEELVNLEEVSGSSQLVKVEAFEAEPDEISESELEEKVDIDIIENGVVMDDKPENVSAYLEMKMEISTIPNLLQGYEKAASDNIPLIDENILMSYFMKFRKSNEKNDETQQNSSSDEKKEEYDNSSVAYVQLRRFGNQCTVIGHLAAENAIPYKVHIVALDFNEIERCVVSANCGSCKSLNGSCKHCSIFLLWLHRYGFEVYCNTPTCFWRGFPFGRDLSIAALFNLKKPELPKIDPSIFLKTIKKAGIVLPGFPND